MHRKFKNRDQPKWIFENIRQIWYFKSLVKSDILNWTILSSFFFLIKLLHLNFTTIQSTCRLLQQFFSFPSPIRISGHVPQNPHSAFKLSRSVRISNPQKPLASNLSRYVTWFPDGLCSCIDQTTLQEYILISTIMFDTLSCITYHTEIAIAFDI